MQINVRVSAMAELTQEGAGRKTTEQLQPAPSLLTFPSASTHTTPFWPVTIKLLHKILKNKSNN